MKGILRACLLVSLQSIVAAHAYEANIHYSTTYVLARAVGWTQADALTIASANRAMDENGAHKVKVQLSHWSQQLTLPLTTQVALSSESTDRKAR